MEGRLSREEFENKIRSYPHAPDDHGRRVSITPDVLRLGDWVHHLVHPAYREFGIQNKG